MAAPGFCCRCVARPTSQRRGARRFSVPSQPTAGPSKLQDPAKNLASRPRAPLLAGSGRFTRQKRSFHASAIRAALQKDPYNILGVGKDASASEIKKAYYKLAKQYHPDTNKSATGKERFVEVQNAYDVLGDDTKRQAWDQFGPASQQPGFDPQAYAAGGGFGASDFANAFRGASGNSSGGFSGFGDASHIFDSFLGAFAAGGGRQRPQNFPGDDIEVAISLTFLEACKGTTRTINITPVVDHADCSGSGIRPGFRKQQCATCRGTGTVSFVVQGGFTVASTCTACGGKGETTPREAICHGCGGQGKIRERKSVEVKIPAGVEDGMAIRQAGKGDAPIEGKGRTGDLLVRMQVMASKTFRRQGANIFTDVNIPFYTAMLGGKVRVPTLEQEVDVRVNSGTQPGQEVLLKNRGVPRVNSGSNRGDLHVKLNVTLPKSLTPTQRAIIEDFTAETEGRPRPSLVPPVEESVTEEKSLPKDSATFTTPEATSTEKIQAAQDNQTEQPSSEPSSTTSETAGQEYAANRRISSSDKTEIVPNSASLLSSAWSGVKSLFGR